MSPGRYSPGRKPLAGIVEVDETFIGGHEPGLAGGRARGKKVLVCVAIEVLEPRGFGRCRMAILADDSAASLQPFVKSYVAPGTTVVTDGWNGYRGIHKFGFVLEQRSQRAAASRGDDPGGLLPGVHRVAALTKRWLLGTHQGAVRPKHLASYLDEFVFRFNSPWLTEPRAVVRRGPLDKSSPATKKRGGVAKRAGWFRNPPTP